MHSRSVLGSLSARISLRRATRNGVRDRSRTPAVMTGARQGVAAADQDEIPTPTEVDLVAAHISPAGRADASPGRHGLVGHGRCRAAGATPARTVAVGRRCPVCRAASCNHADWGISSVGIGAPVTEIHRGDCFAGGKALRPVSAERARAELADGVRACGVCRPDTVLNKP
ncbi:DUF6233 domain-containing protein [Streptomyces sp. NPDC020755]|uniref:DUF6233 domain-containing protein n=1 Tax=unclassified Streptomyces TaxID=2593676 RepID=UPI00340F4520